MPEIKVGIDIGGTKMLLIANGAGISQRDRLDTGKDFSGDDALIAITKWLDKLPNYPTSMGIAIPGLVSPSGEVVACDVLPQLQGWFPAAELKCAVRVLNDAEAGLHQAIAQKTRITQL